MAIQMNFSDRFGGDNANSYWVVSSVTVDTRRRVAASRVDGWRDKASHDAGAQPIASKLLSVTGSAFDSYATAYAAGQTDLFALAQTIALADPFFSGATSV